MALLPMSSTARDIPLFQPVLEASLHQQVIWVLLGLATYLALVSSLRFQRKQALHKKYNYYATRQSMGSMTDQDAWAIQKSTMQAEFPFIVIKSLQFALFRVGMTPPSRWIKADRGRRMAFPQYPPCSWRPPSSHTLQPHSNDTPIQAPWLANSWLSIHVPRERRQQ